MFQARMPTHKAGTRAPEGQNCHTPGQVKIQRETRCALPFATGLSLTVAHLRNDRGDRFLKLSVGSLPALSPSRAGSLRTDNH